MLDYYRTPLTVAGRILIALMFLVSGFSKLSDPQSVAAYIASAGLPQSPILAGLVGLFEVLAGLAIATGYMARWAALLLAIFTVVASLMYHRFWSLPAELQAVQQPLFMKNVAIAGGLLVLAALGPGPASLGARMRGSAARARASREGGRSWTKE